MRPLDSSRRLPAKVQPDRRAVECTGRLGRMPDAKVAVSDIIVDCQSPERLARFWSAVLGLEVGTRDGAYVALERFADQHVGIAFQEVPESKAGKNRVHFDISSSDPAATASLVLELGGRRAPEYEDGGFLVMADPEGNEFCIVTFDPIQLDAQGRTHYADDIDIGH
jgi:predicted enzyme related to lactoylglutathione lyase